MKKGLVMLYGDSGFTVWKNTPYGANPNAEEVLLGRDGEQAVVNHGFGGSTAEEQLYYYDRAVKPWAPRALVLRTFSNDAMAGYSPLEAVFLQTRLMEYARRDFPGIRFYLCNSIPRLSWRAHTPARRAATAEYNELAADYCEKHADAVLLDQTGCPLFYRDPARIGEPENIRDELYISDNVHLNREGYELYGKFFAEALRDVL